MVLLLSLLSTRALADVAPSCGCRSLEADCATPAECAKPSAMPWSSPAMAGALLGGLLLLARRRA